MHAEAPSWECTDWTEIVGLYDLMQCRPSPVVALNRAVAVGFAHGADAGLAALDELAGEPALATYPYPGMARADLLRRATRLSQPEKYGCCYTRRSEPLAADTDHHG